MKSINHVGIISSTPKTTGGLLYKLSSHCVDQITSRLQGKNSLSAIRVWNPSTDTDTRNAVRNSYLWADDIRSQLTGYLSWKTSWRQASGGVAITRRHLLQCSHYNDVFTSFVVRFIRDGGGSEGEYFETTIIRQYPITGSMSYQGDSYDLEVFLLQDELPEWVNIYPIIDISPPLYDILPSSNTVLSSGSPILPLVSISQGMSNGSPTQYQKLYINNAWYYSEKDPVTNASYGKQHPNPTVHPYFYDVYTGDSGTPTFILIDGVLYLYAIVVGWGFGLQSVYGSSHKSYINELIRQVDASHSINTGLSATSVNLLDVLPQ